MKIIELEQGTEEWLAWRRSRFMASEAPIIMGAAPDWMADNTWTHLRELKAGFTTMFSDFAQMMLDKGHAKEEVVRDRWNEAVPPDDQIRPVCIEDDNGVYAASLDGLSADGRSWHEIKTTVHGRKSAIYKAVKATSRPPEYVQWQMCHQGFVLGDPDATVHLWVYVDDKECLHEEYPVKEIFEWCDISMLTGEWMRFDNGEPQNPLIETPEWVEAEKKWRSSKRVVDEATESLDEAKQKLVKLALADNQLKVRSDVILLQRIDKAGGTDWKAAFNALLEAAISVTPDKSELFAEIHAEWKALPDQHQKAGSRYWQIKKIDTSPQG